MSNKPLKFDKIHWHDGLIRNLSINLDKAKSKDGTIEMSVSVYENEKTANRYDIKLFFDKVIHFSVNCDVFTVHAAYDFGNIAGCECYEKKFSGIEKMSIRDILNQNNCVNKEKQVAKKYAVYRMYLNDGYIEIISGLVRITKIGEDKLSCPS